MNGTITGFAGNGIFFNKTGGKVDHLTVSKGGIGITTAADLSVSNCQFNSNSNQAIYAGQANVLVTNSQFIGSVTVGIQMYSGAVIGSVFNGTAINATGGPVLVSQNMFSGVKPVQSGSYVSPGNNVCAAGTAC